MILTNDGRIPKVAYSLYIIYTNSQPQMSFPSRPNSKLMQNIKNTTQSQPTTKPALFAPNKHPQYESMIVQNLR